MTYRAGRVLMALGAAIGAFVLTLTTLLFANARDTFEQNLIARVPRVGVMVFTILSVIATFWVGAVLVRRHKERGLEALDWHARLLSPLVTLPLFFALTQRGIGTELEQASLLAVFVLGLERLLRVSFTAWAERPLASTAPSKVETFFSEPRRVLGLVIGLSLAHGLLMSVWAVWAHGRFATYGYDLGQYDQLFQETLHGRWMAAPAMAHPDNWGDLASSHADFILFPLLPFYALHPRATTPLVMQAMLIATAAVPIYLFARERISNHWAFVLALAWLLYPPMHQGQMYDVHTQPFGAVFVVWAIWALETRRNTLYWVFFALALSCREDVSMGLAVLGLFLVFSGHRVRQGVITAAISTVYFVIIRFLVMGSGAFANIYKDLSAPGDQGFGAIVETWISNPVFTLRSLLSADKARYFMQMLAPLAFLPVRRAALWVLLVPASILTLFSTGYGPLISTSFQYVFNWSQYAFPLAAVVLGLFGASAEGLIRQRAAIFTVLAATVLANLMWGAYSPSLSLQGGFGVVPLQRPSDADRQREEDLAVVMAKVPEDASLCTSERLQSHTTYHLNNWSLKDGVFDCDYLVWSNSWEDRGSERVPPLLASHQYVVELRQGSLTLVKKVRP